VAVGSGGSLDTFKAAAVTIEGNAARHAERAADHAGDAAGRRLSRSLRAVAKALNARGIATARGDRWQAMTVINLLARMS
jgi:hypothetical protein